VRLPFPERIPLPAICYFAGILCALQLIEGTSGVFALCCLFFIIVSGLAFNFAGGLSRPSGAYVFFFSTLTLIVGVCWKAILGEPADSNLDNPKLVISLYLGFSCAMFAAVLLSRSLVTKRAILENVVRREKMQTAIVGCLITGFLLIAIPSFFPDIGGNGSFFSAITQINQFLPLAIILGTIYTIRRSGGTRSVNLPVILAMLSVFGFGLLGFSKQGMFTPPICWLLAAASQRYSISKIQIALCFLMVFFSFRYLVPFAQYGRDYRGDTFSSNLENVGSMLSNLGEVRQKYLENAEDTDESVIHSYYDEPQGFFDRLQAVSMDAALISYKNQTSTFMGLQPIFSAFANFVPHVIWKEKPITNPGNSYAHEIGLLADNDTTTGVSFSPVADAYAMLGWAGVLLVSPVIISMLFIIFDSLCGDVRETPWGLAVIVVFAHVAPEGGIGGAIYCMGFVAFGIVFAAVVGAYVMPFVGTMLIGPEGIAIRRGTPVRGIPNRLRPSSSQNG
jgi:hypothetical protein